MRRLLLFLVAFVTAVTAAGCGLSGSGGGVTGAPEPGELARESLRAAAAAGSVRYGFTATLTAEGQAPMSFTVNGAAGKGAARADVSLSGNGQSLAGTLLFDRSGLFVRFLGKWYGEQMPFAQAGELRRQFGTDNGFSDRFDDFSEGEVSEGPVADGVPTWAYNGRLNADAILDLMTEEGDLDDEVRDRVEEFAGNTRFTLLVGKADHLPRAFQLDVSGEGLDFTGVTGGESTQMAVSLRGSFTEWGRPVRVTAPGAYAPLVELYQQFFGF